MHRDAARSAQRALKWLSLVKEILPRDVVRVDMIAKN